MLKPSRDAGLLWGRTRSFSPIKHIRCQAAGEGHPETVGNRGFLILSFFLHHSRVIFRAVYRDFFKAVNYVQTNYTQQKPETENNIREMAHRLRETSITTPDHWDNSRLIAESSQGHDRFFLFQLKNTSVEKKKIPNFRGS